MSRKNICIFEHNVNILFQIEKKTKESEKTKETKGKVCYTKMGESSGTYKNAGQQTGVF